MIPGFETWTCHICGKEREDRFISVISGPLKGFKGARMNVRYCRDNDDCFKKAAEAIKSGRWPGGKKL